MQSITYVAGAELPALLIQLIDESNNIIDMTGFTASLKLGLDTGTTALSKTTGFTCGTNGVQVGWTAGELSLNPGTYIGQLTATFAGLDYVRQFALTIEPALS